MNSSALLIFLLSSIYNLYNLGVLVMPEMAKIWESNTDNWSPFVKYSLSGLQPCGW
jgi:hypothetical protein